MNRRSRDCMVVRATSACDIDMPFVHGRMLLSPLVLICMYEMIIIYDVIYYQF